MVTPGFSSSYFIYSTLAFWNGTWTSDWKESIFFLKWPSSCCTAKRVKQWEWMKVDFWSEPMRILKIFVGLRSHGEEISWCSLRKPKIEGTSRLNYGRRGHGLKQLFHPSDELHQYEPSPPHISQLMCFVWSVRIATSIWLNDVFTRLGLQSFSYTVAVFQNNRTNQSPNDQRSISPEEFVSKISNTIARWNTQKE
jgi:hypothetical protein